MPLSPDQEYHPYHKIRGTGQGSFDEQPVEGFTLADYVVAFLRRWKLAATVVIIFLVGGLGVVVLKSRPPVPFPYTTVIEVGRFADGTPLESLDVVRERTQTAYIPKVLLEHAIKGGYEQERYKVKVGIFQGEVKKGEVKEGEVVGGSFVTLKTKGSDQDQEEILSIHNDIVGLLLKDHEHRAELVKRGLEREKFQVDLKLEELKGREKFFPRRYDLLDDTAKLLQSQIKATHDLVSSLERDRSTALVSATSQGLVDQSLATILLFVDTDITRNREKVRELEERLEVNIPKERAVLEQEELDNKRFQKEQEQLLSEIEFKKDSIQRTTPVLPPSRLLKGPKQIPWVKIMAIAGGAGLVVAFFMVWIVELAVNAKRYTQVAR